MQFLASAVMASSDQRTPLVSQPSAGTTQYATGHVAVACEEQSKEESLWSEKMRDIYLNYVTLSVTTFGGPQAHIAMFHERFVDKLKWISEARFAELLGIGSCIPGPTSTEVATAIGALRCGIPGALLALITFQLPGALIMFFAGLAMKNAFEVNDGEAPSWLAEATVGLKPASISLIVLAAHKLGLKICGQDTLKLAIAFISAYFTIWMPAHCAAWGYPLILIGSGLTTVLDAKFNKARAHLYVKSSDSTLNSDGHTVAVISKRAGLLLFAIWLAVLLVSVFARSVLKVSDPYFQLFETFYRVGSLIFGGGQVALPMLSTEMVSKGWLSAGIFFDGLALVQALPGPMFNLSAYLGAAYLGKYLLVCTAAKLS